MSFAMQVLLATDSVGTLGKDGDAIMSQNVIAAQEVAVTAVEGLPIKLGSHGTPPRQGEGAKEPANGARTRSTLWNIVGYHSNCIQSNLRLKGGTSLGYWGLARVPPPMLVLPLLQRSENAMCSDHE